MLLKYYKTIFPFIIIALFFSCDRENINANEGPYQGPDIIVVDSLKINRKVLVIGIDGFRSDVMQQNFTPFMYNLSQKNNVYYNQKHLVERITYSGPNWSSMLTGVHMNKHNVTDNSFENNNYNNYPPFFHYIEKVNDDINTASIVNWTPINTYILSNQVDVTPIESISDSGVFEYAKNMLLNTKNIDADVLFLQFDELDGSGHSYGFSPLVEEYTNTANILDSYAEELFNIIENRRSSGEDWIYFIISDHGGEETGHGDADNPNINQTVFFAQHSSLQFKANCCYQSSQADLAPTILDFLGISSSQFEFNTDGLSVLE